MPKIVRLTLFKIPDQDLVKEAIQMYNTLAQDAKKVRQSMTLTRKPTASNPMLPFPELRTYPLSQTSCGHHVQNVPLVHSAPARQAVSSRRNPRLF